MWSILAHLHPVQHGKHPTRVSKYEPFQNELKFDGIAFPVNLQDITKFESQNGISVNVFGYDPADWIYPLRVTKAECEKHVDLLYIVDEDENRHYCLIKNFNGLMHRYTKHQHKKFFLQALPSRFPSRGAAAGTYARLCRNQWSTEDVSTQSR